MHFTLGGKSLQASQYRLELETADSTLGKCHMLDRLYKLKLAAAYIAYERVALHF